MAEEARTEGALDLTHLDGEGNAHMVDVAAKAETRRVAIAAGFVSMEGSTLDLIEAGGAAKGDVIAVARVAGIMAAKRTADLIPLCHPIALTSVTVDLHAVRERADRTGIEIEATAETVGRTGVEMEALTAASVAGLTIYDMCKAVDRGMTVSDIRLMRKEGGRSGTWTREEGS